MCLCANVSLSSLCVDVSVSFLSMSASLLSVCLCLRLSSLCLFCVSVPVSVCGCVCISPLCMSVFASLLSVCLCLCIHVPSLVFVSFVCQIYIIYIILNYKYLPSSLLSDKTVEKCIADCDNEGWSIICSGGEPELGNLIIVIATDTKFLWLHLDPVIVT